MTEVLTNLDCKIFINGSVVSELGKPFTSLYFNYKNGVRVVNPFLGLNITDLPEESFFGDYQILLGSTAVYNYIAHSDFDNTWCMTICSVKFYSLCQQFPHFRNFLLVRGL